MGNTTETLQWLRIELPIKLETGQVIGGTIKNIYAMARQTPSGMTLAREIDDTGAFTGRAYLLPQDNIRDCKPAVMHANGVRTNNELAI